MHKILSYSKRTNIIIMRITYCILDTSVYCILDTSVYCILDTVYTIH